MYNENRVKQIVNQGLEKLREKSGQLFGMGRYIFYSSTGQKGGSVKTKNEKRQFDVDGFKTFSEVLFRSYQQVSSEDYDDSTEETQKPTLRERFLFF